MSHHEHRRHAPSAAALAILTVSDTRTPESDTSGREIRRLLEESGHRVVDYRILPDEPAEVRAAVEGWLSADGCDGVVVSGGTGISARDRTYEALTDLVEKRLDGFGELFRMLSYSEIASAAMLSRAMGGVVGRRVLFCLPGSTAAVRLGMEKLILPELGHLLNELHK